MTSEGAAMTPLSDSEAATVARFENAEPAPESWGGGLREAVALAIYASDFGDIGDWDEERDTFQGEYRANADAVLALPEIAALRAKADAADRVRAVRFRVQRALDEGVPILQAQQVADHLDRALDGPPPC